MRLGLRGRFVAFVSAIVIAFGVVLTALSVRAVSVFLQTYMHLVLGPVFLLLGMFLVVPVLGVVATTWRSVLRILGATEDEIPGPPDPHEAVEEDGAVTPPGDLTSEPDGAA